MSARSLLVVLFFGAVPVSAQLNLAWIARYNGPGSWEDGIRSVAIDDVGNVYVAGYSAAGLDNSTHDYATVKYSPSGALQWVRRYNGPANGNDGAQKVRVGSDGSVYVTGGSTGDTTGTDITTVKYDPAGAAQWVVRWDGPGHGADYPWDMAIDPLGNVVVTGTCYEGSTPANGYVTLKYTPSGQLLWSRQYYGSTTRQSVAYALAIDAGGNIHVAGVSGAGSANIVTVRYAPDGFQQWVREYNGPANGEDGGVDIADDGAGNIVVAGYSEGTGPQGDYDYATIKYSPAGAVLWVRRYNGPANGFDEPRAIAVDGGGNIFVTGTSEGTGPGGNDYATIKYSATGDSLWLRRFDGGAWDMAVAVGTDRDGSCVVTGESAAGGLDIVTIRYSSSGDQLGLARYDGPGNQNDQPSDLAVQPDGSVLMGGASWGGGASWNDYVTVKYTPPLVVARPRAGERWMGGAADTIRWKGRQLGQFVTVEFSADSGRTYSVVHPAVLADSLIWVSPDSIATRRARMRVRTTSSPADTAVSDTFTVKGPLLTRIGADGNYDLFLPTHDGWSFANAAGNWWPQSWWSQFQYAGGIDRHTGAPYDPIFPADPIYAFPPDFPDWPVFVDVFGRDACFWFNTNVYRESKVEFWSFKKTVWNGSCFGIAQSALLYFHYRQQFLQRHPTIPSTDSLATVRTMTDAIRATVNRYFTMQYGRLKRNHDLNNLTTTPRQVLQSVRQMWANDYPDDDAGLKYRDTAGSGGHAVIPYRLQRVAANPSQFRLYVCNSNSPQSFNDFILIDSLTNRWQEFTGFGWASWTVQMHLYPPVLGFFSPTVFPSGPLTGGTEEAAGAGGGRLEIGSPWRSDVRIMGPGGDSIGVRGGRAFNSISGALPLIPETGLPHPPLGYDVPPGSYRIHVSNPVDSAIVISAGTDSLSISYSRTRAVAGERDELWYDGGVGVKNPDAVQKRVNLQVLAQGDSSDRTANITGLSLAQNDSVSAAQDAQSRPKLVNYGPQKSYQLQLRNSTPRGLRRFQSATLTIPAQSAHIIAPRWDSLSSTVLRIYVDLGNNGTIDDTLRIANTLDVEEGGDRGALEIPRDYELGQNYPNPFNPSTRIDYAMPHAGRVRLTVHDVLGRLVRTLADEHRAAGRWTAEWDGTTNAGVKAGSGLYFYRIEIAPESGNAYAATRKMVLVK